MVPIRSEQITAANSLKSGKILLGGVGSGKTRTAIYFLSKYCSDLRFYVITTAVKRNTRDWEKEGELFGVRFEAVDSWNNITRYTDVKNSFFIFDEHRLASYGVWVKSFLRIARSNGWILLTATPGDTWMDYAPVFIANGFYKNISEFKHKHVVYSPYVKYPKISRYSGISTLLRLRSKVVVRMESNKRAVSNEFFIDCSYNKEQYNMITKSRLDPFELEPIYNVSKTWYLLRKVVNSDPSRLDAVRSLLTKHDRLIVFYNFDYELHILKMLSDSIETSMLNGHSHDPVPTGAKWLYLVQYSAGAEAWNCIETNAMVFYSLSYSYKSLVQARGRIDRLNTEYKELFYYRLRSTSPIDVAIQSCLDKKKTFNQKDFESILGLAG